MSEQDTLTVNEAAALLGWKPYRVYGALEAGQLPGKRHGKMYRLPRQEIERRALELRTQAERSLEAFGLLAKVAEASREHWAKRVAAAQQALDAACGVVREKYTFLVAEQKSGGIARKTITDYRDALTQLQDTLRELEVLDKMAAVLDGLDAGAMAEADAVRKVAVAALEARRDASGR